MYGAGEAFDSLLDRLWAMGAPAPRYGRVNGQCTIWLECKLPAGSTERIAANLDAAARAILDLDLSASDRDQEAAKARLA